MGARVRTEAEGVGQVFGRLTVLGWGGKTKRNHQLWRCLCECGKTVEVEYHDLLIRKSVSCGCQRQEWLARGMATLSHGATSCQATPEQRKVFGIWAQMRKRCTNPNAEAFADYGGRGITVDPAWDDFAVFWQDMGPCPPSSSLERRDVNLGYAKDNCCWLPRRKQNENKRSTIRIRYLEREWCFKRLCEHLEVPYLKVYKRYVMRGWDLARSLELNEENTYDLKHIE